MKVLIYSIPECQYCKMAKAFLKENNVKYTDIDVSKDEIKAEEMIDKSGQMAMPVIVAEKEGKEEFVIGFDQGKLEELLGIN